MRAFRTTAAVALTLSGVAIAGCGGGHQQSTSNGDVGPGSSAAAPAGPAASSPNTTPDQPHHSKLAGAAVGGLIGHELGGHAVAGAAAGALIQHHRNKKSR